MSYCQDDWPDRNQLHGIINQYWPFRSKLTARISIRSLCLDILDALYEGHQEISKCMSRVQQTVW